MACYRPVVMLTWPATPRSVGAKNSRKRCGGRLSEAALYPTDAGLFNGRAWAGTLGVR